LTGVARAADSRQLGALGTDPWYSIFADGPLLVRPGGLAEAPAKARVPMRRREAEVFNQAHFDPELWENLLKEGCSDETDDRGHDDRDPSSRSLREVGGPQGMNRASTMACLVVRVADQRRRTYGVPPSTLPRKERPMAKAPRERTG
jgi:hypothetical protein